MPLAAVRSALLVEDDATARRRLTRILERAAFKVHQADHGCAAVDLFERHRTSIAVTLLNMEMDEIDGPGTLYQLRKIAPTLTVVFITGRTSPYSRSELISMGPAGVFSKPVRRVGLEKLLRRFLLDT